MTRETRQPPTQENPISSFLVISGLTLKGEIEKAREEIEGLIDYLQRVGEGFKVTKWDFSPSLPLLEEFNFGENQKLLSLISLLKGEITLEQFKGQ